MSTVSQLAQVQSVELGKQLLAPAQVRPVTADQGAQCHQPLAHPNEGFRRASLTPAVP